jgi:hypothetical protein
MWSAPEEQEMTGLVRAVLGITRSAARSLVSQVATSGDTEFVSEVMLHSKASPRGYHGGATRWRLSQTRPGWVLEQVERDVEPHAASHKEGDRRDPARPG